jgi:UDP-N-acetylmuramoyl-tripeptide--D-alanyl-D-alanine ligase
MAPAEDIYSLFLKFPVISTDSRNVAPGSIFFAIRGDQHNGNQFAAEALNKGASYAIIDDPSVKSGDAFILVADTLETLQQISRIHREKMSSKVIGITGSNGKTTTKELIGRVLGTSFNTIVTRGNLNNHIGVPLTLLSVTNDTSFAVVEMGANHQGEIAQLCRLARPDYGLITNIGKAHLEGFGGFEGVVKAKSELYDFIREHSGHLFVNIDNPILKRLAERMTYTGYGTAGHAFCTGNILHIDPFLAVSWSSGNMKGIIQTGLYGEYNFENVLAAICVGLYFDISPEKISEAISTFIPDNNRSQVIRTGRNVIVMDAYNANPSSMKAALLNFSRTDSGSKMAILGDMMELGEHSMEEHQDLIAFASGLGFDKLFFIGENFSKAMAGKGSNFFRDATDAETWFRENIISGMTILLKGSRKMKMENLRNLF